MLCIQLFALTFERYKINLKDLKKGRDRNYESNLSR